MSQRILSAFLLLFAASAWGQTNITTTNASVPIVTVVSNDYTSIALVKFHDGRTASMLMPVSVTNKYIQGFGEQRLAHSHGQPSTNWCDVRFEHIPGPGPQWSAPPPMPLLPGGTNR